MYKRQVEDNNDSLLAAIGGAVAFIFLPLGFGVWQATVGVVGGLVAKEDVYKRQTQGMVILVSVFQPLAPSILAASSRSSGTLCKPAM